MKKKILTCVLSVVMITSMLTACGGYDNSSLDVSKIDVDKYISQLGEYKNLSIETEKKQVVDDETVEQYVTYVLSTIGTTTREVDREIQNGDIANIDYEGYVDGVQFNGGTRAGYDLEIGSGKFINGFEDGLIGYKAGDEVSLNLTFPEQYTEELAGKDVVFKVKINKVSENAAPELTEEMVTQFGIPNVTTIDEFKAYVKSTLEDSAETIYINSLRDHALNAVYDSTVFASDELPKELFDYYVEKVRADDKDMAAQYGISFEDYITNYYATTMEDYTSQINERAKVMTKDILISEKIARENGISFDEQTLEEKIKEEADNYGYESVDEFKKVIGEDEYKNYLIELTVVDMILDTATITEVESTDFLSE